MVKVEPLVLLLVFVFQTSGFAAVLPLVFASGCDI